MIGSRTRHSLVQFLALQGPEIAIVMFSKYGVQHLSLSSDQLLYGLLNIVRALDDRTLMQVLAEIVADRQKKTQNHSHSIVAGGFPLMSYTTRLMPRTSLMMRLDTLPSSSWGSGAQCAVMKSCVCTARNATTHS